MNLHALDAFFFNGLEIQSRSADGYGLLLQINCVLALFFCFFNLSPPHAEERSAHPSHEKEVKLFKVAWAMSQRSKKADVTNKKGSSSSSRRWTLEWYVNLDLVNNDNNNENRNRRGMACDDEEKTFFLHVQYTWSHTRISLVGLFNFFFTRRWHWNFHKMKRK